MTEVKDKLFRILYMTILSIVIMLVWYVKFINSESFIFDWFYNGMFILAFVLFSLQLDALIAQKADKLVFQGKRSRIHVGKFLL